MASELAELMPQVADCTQMWWAEGFPSHTPTAPWLRVIQTGRFALALNTESLRVEHFGAVGSLDDDFRKLPPAELALTMSVDGKKYRCTAGGKWSRFTGPRLIESGRFFQRGDVTNLEFKADDGARLNAEARFETAAWSDRLGLILAARPGVRAIDAGEASFGRVGGGFGLDGTNHFEVAHRAELDPETFTLELWAFVPSNYRASERVPPWLVCQNRNEATDGNYGLIIAGGFPEARLNIGGGSSNAVTLAAAKQHVVRIDEWNHLAISYDGDVLRLYLNGAWAGERKLGRRRVAGQGGLAFGRRQDNSGDGYHFRGVIDEARLYDRALSLDELRQHWNKPEALAETPKPIAEWTFKSDGTALMKPPREPWKSAALEIKLTTAQGQIQQHWEVPKGESWAGDEWHDVALALDPVAFKTLEPRSAVNVAATELATNGERPVSYDAALGWHRINLDGIESHRSSGRRESKQRRHRAREAEALESQRQRSRTARLMFEKTARGIRQAHRAHRSRASQRSCAITRATRPASPCSSARTGTTNPKAACMRVSGSTASRRCACRAKAEDRTRTHARLRTLGRRRRRPRTRSFRSSAGAAISSGIKARSARGARAFVTSRIKCRRTAPSPMCGPRWCRSTGKQERWGWTSNVGGGDFFRVFDPAGKRVAHTAMRTTYHRQGPCLTEVTYAGRIGIGMTHSTTVSLARTDDVRARDLSAPPRCEKARRLLALRHFPDRRGHLQRHPRTQDGARQRNRPAQRMGHAMGRQHLPHRANGMHRPHPVDFAARSRAA